MTCRAPFCSSAAARQLEAARAVIDEHDRDASAAESFSRMTAWRRLADDASIWACSCPVRCQSAAVE